jgi:hypothetical protein
MRTTTNERTSKLRRLTPRWQQMAVAGLGALAFTVGCVPPPDQSAGEPGRLGFGESEAVVHVDTNRRVVMETSTGSRAGAAPAESGTELAQSALTNTVGTITTKVFLCATGIPASINVLRCTVPGTFVLVGGGAWASSSGGAGAMLTASYPFDSNLTTWEGRSKDHGVVDKHIISVYAIGMMVQGLPRETLRAHIALTESTSTLAAHPQVSVSGASNDIGLSGGAKVNYTGAGSMLVSSFPACGGGFRPCNRWSVAAKDHVYSDPATITGYIITIRENLPIAGVLRPNTMDNVAGNGSQAGPGSLRFAIERGSVLTGLGAFSHTRLNEPPGRMLVRMGPATSSTDANEVIFEDKDHLEPDLGFVEGFAVLLQ